MVGLLSRMQISINVLDFYEMKQLTDKCWVSLYMSIAADSHGLLKN